MRPALLLLALLSACALSPERVATDRVAAGDAVAAGAISPYGDRLAVVAGLREIGGRVLLCGAWSGDGFYARHYAADILGAGIASAGGRRLRQNLTFFLEAPGGPPGPGAPAGCAETGLAPGAAGPVTLRLPAITVERDCDEMGCDLTRFRQTL